MNIKLKILVFILLGAGSPEAQTAIPDIPISNDALNYLSNKGVVELVDDGFFVESASQPVALAKTSGCCSVIRFLKRNVADPVAGVVNYSLDAANAVVTSTTDGVKWVVDKSTDGVQYVVEKTSDATVWTLNSAIDGTQLVIKETAKGVSWAVTAPIPSDISINGKKYLRLDPVKKTLRAGILLPVKFANATTDVAQAATTYLVNVNKELAVGTLDMVDGVTFIAMDVTTFASGSSVDIAQALANLDAKSALIKVLKTAKMALTNVLNWGELGWCGSLQEGPMSTYLIIPDYWPADEPLSSLLGISFFLSGAAQQCRLFGLARMYKGCIVHDDCYGVPGFYKNACDLEIKDFWNKACADSYGSSGYCHTLCTANMAQFWSIMTENSQPAYDAAQKKAAENPTLAQTTRDRYFANKNKYLSGSNDYPAFTKPQPPSFVSMPAIFVAPTPNTKFLPVILNLLQ